MPRANAARFARGRLPHLLAWLLVAAFADAARADFAPGGGMQENVIFADYSEMSRGAEIARRMMSPLTNLQIARGTPDALNLQAIDLSRERFRVYVPHTRPSRGYGLLVFVPPWEDARLPPGWEAALDDSGVIFVCAAKSGNDESILDRRIPLALLGAHNILRRHPIDVDRVYVGGFSGGSRVALRVALGYPDLFRGAILNAGSDVIGNSQAVLPPGDLFARFQTSRIVYATGSDDAVNLNQDMGSLGSLAAWCVFGTHVQTMFHAGHDIVTGSGLRQALGALDRGHPVDTDKLAACKARLAMELAAEVARIEDLIVRDKPREARRLLGKLDARHGGLALAKVTELEQRLDERDPMRQGRAP